MQPHKWAAQKDLCFESWVQCSSINTLISAAGTFVSFAADFTPKLSIFVYYSRPATMRQQLHWVCHNLRINNWNFNRPMTVILSRQLSNSWCLCQQHVKTIWLKFGKLFSTSIQGLLDWVPLSFSVETFSLSVENIFLSPQKKVCSRSWVSWMISIFMIMIRCKQSQVRVCGGNENKIKDREMLTSQRVKFHWEMGFPRCLATLCPLLYLRQWAAT